MELQQQKELEQRYVMGTFARKPICLVEGDGMRVIDDEGNALLDFIAGIGVCSLGHCHPALVEAIQKQAAKLIHVSNYYYIEKRGEVSRLLCDMLNAHLPEEEKLQWQTFYSNSGAESNECAMKLARLYARRFGNGGIDIVTLERSFHGRTMETLAATAQPVKQEAFQPLPGGFLHTPINDLPALKALFEDPANKICAV
ncbi:MAG: aminotransferase class III-fold pyridoxal phosphate-dependent enzyme, partial [Eggerthellaceae bacterium]|nr:aminotransferase class III-fold pyridoxal phosphate-dependent enzyme [Eggerthellaceae bacterium]